MSLKPKKGFPRKPTKKDKKFNIDKVKQPLLMGNQLEQETQSFKVAIKALRELLRRLLNILYMTIRRVDSKADDFVETK